MYCSSGRRSSQNHPHHLPHLPKSPGPVPPAFQPQYARIKVTLTTSCKMSELFENSPLSGAGKHHNFQVTACHHFVTTNPNYAYIKSEKKLIFYKNTNISQKFFTSIGLSKWRELKVSIMVYPALFALKKGLYRINRYKPPNYY